MTKKASKHARELLLKEYQGVLSTHSKALPGYPFGSVVPYCLDALGRPLILISRIAQHTRNLQDDAKCSLLVGDRTADDSQAAARLTLLADAQRLQEPEDIEAAAQRYFRYFPQAGDYHKTHDFDFWCLTPVRARYIGGFGAIHWLDQVHCANPFSGPQETSMLEHMNADHARAIAHYLHLSGIPADASASLVGIDAEGFHLRAGGRLYWLPFAQACNSALEVRQALVALARAEVCPWTVG